MFEYVPAVGDIVIGVDYDFTEEEIIKCLVGNLQYVTDMYNIYDDHKTCSEPHTAFTWDEVYEAFPFLDASKRTDLLAQEVL